MRLKFVKACVQNGVLARENALDLLNGPLTPGDESTQADDRDLLDKTDTEIVAIFFPDLRPPWARE